MNCLCVADWICRRGIATLFVHGVPIGGEEEISGNA